MANLLNVKIYPNEYNIEAIKIITTLSEGDKIEIVGSASIKSQKYSGDYDTIVQMKGDPNIVAFKIQNIVKKLKKNKNCHIQDIKSGEIPEWNIMAKPYNKSEALAKIDKLKTDGVLLAKEAKEAKQVLPESETDKLKFIIATKFLRFHIIRWSPIEIKKGEKILKDKRVYKLSTAVQQGLTKIDCIGYVHDRYVEFSAIYSFNDFHPFRYGAYLENVKNDILFYEFEGNKFKILKRKFLLARAKNNTADIIKYTAIFNSDKGRLYQLISDIKVILELLEDNKGSISKINYEIKNFISRLSNIHFKEFIAEEPEIIEKIKTVYKSKKDLVKLLEYLLKKLSNILNKAV